MIKNPIYRPAGAALEYAEYALNLYNGCPHGCHYCYARGIARKTYDEFRCYKEREGILEAAHKQLAAGDWRGKLIHLCFTCDPFPMGGDGQLALSIIEAIHAAGAHVQILTKGKPPEALWGLLTPQDKFGVTLTCRDSLNEKVEPYAAYNITRQRYLGTARCKGVQVFISMEPVLDMPFALRIIQDLDYVDEFRIGKLNHNPALEQGLRDKGYLNMPWGDFGREAEQLCKECGRNYMIKTSLKKELEK